MRSLLYLVIAVSTVYCSVAQGFIQSEQFSQNHLKDLETNEQGFIENTSGDGYFVLNNIQLTREQMCGLSLGIEFQRAPIRASGFEVYWRTAQTQFSESQKGSFFINQRDATQQNTYLIPLCKLYGFSGNINQSQNQANITSLRIDYPPNKTIALRFSHIHFLDSIALAETAKNDEVVSLVPYERIAGHSATSLDVIIPKLIFSFEEGLSRLKGDIPFFIFWLLLIIFLKWLILMSYVRQFRRDN